jgi:hypothetical protein
VRSFSSDVHRAQVAFAKLLRFGSRLRRRRASARNAASVAGMLLTTEALIAEKPEEKKGGGMPDMGGMGDMM